MKKIAKISTLITLFATSFLIGQSVPNQFSSGSIPKGKLTGYLIDAQTGQPIEYGNVVIVKYSDSTLVNGTVSGSQGNFTMEVPYGKYFLKASFIGYSTKILDSLKVNPRNLEVDLGKIALDESSIEIDNVVVTGEKQMIINNLDKKVINVEKDLTGTGGSATDVVQNIPSVTVDVNGNVSYRGNQNLVILIDGKPSSMMGMSNADILANLPASSIESIELVTNPSARYDPDGSSGILNFILKKKMDGGINGNISATAGTGDKYNGSINLNHKLTGFNFFASYDARMFENENNGTTSRVNNFNNLPSYLNQANNGLFDFSSHNITVGMDYMPDDFNTFTFSYRFRKFGFDSDNFVENTSLNSFEEVTGYFERSSVADRGVNSNNYTASFKRTFETKGSELTADIIFGDNSMNRDENIVQTNFNNDFTPTNEPPYLERGLSDNSNQQWTFQSNYINPIEGFGRIETGFKVSLKDLNSLNNYEYFDNESSTWTNKLLSNTDFLYHENIYAVYGIYSNSIDKFQYQIGLRAEQANVNGNESITSSSFEKSYFALYPTVHLTQGLPDDQEIQLSYSRRVERPNNRQLNPYVDRSDSLNVQFGNPRLSPEFVNSLDLGYSKFFNKTSLTSSIFYKLTDDAISTVTFITGNGVSETTWLNIAKSQSYGVELTAAHPFTDWLRMNGSFSYFNTAFEAQDVIRKDNSWIGKLSGVIFFSKDFNVQLNANYNSPIITPQGRIKEVFSADFAAKKDFMDGRLSLTFRVSDIFNTRKMESEISGFNFNSISYRKMESRVAYLGISYKLSSGKSKDSERRRRTDEGGMEEF